MDHEGKGKYPKTCSTPEVVEITSEEGGVFLLRIKKTNVSFL